MSFFRKCPLSSSSGRQLLDKEGWGRYRKKSWCCPSFGSWGKTALSWHQLLCLACWVAVETQQQREVCSHQYLQWLKVLNTSSGYSIWAKQWVVKQNQQLQCLSCIKDFFSVNQGSPPHFPLACTSLQNCFCQSNIVFFNIHSFLSLTWLSWQSRPNC